MVANLPDDVIPEDEVLAERVKNVETAGLTAFGTKLVSSAVGAGTVGASEMVVPLLASFEAGNATDTFVQSLMDDDTPDNIKGSIGGAYGGTVGAGTFIGAAKAQQAVVRSVTSSVFGGGKSVAAEGIEMAAAETAAEAAAVAGETAVVAAETAAVVGETAAVAAEVTGLAAAEAALLTATEVTDSKC